MKCPCGSGTQYADCCGVYHDGTPAPTPEALMRSRYSAYVLKDAAYLKQTWHPTTRPRSVDLDDPDFRWTGLTVLGSTGGSAFHTEGTVEFEARYRDHGKSGAMRENSAFRREEGRWLYVAPVQPPA